MSGDDSKKATTGFACLGGAEPSTETVLGLKDLLRLPLGAKQQLWEVLGPALRHPLPGDLDAQFDMFRRKHEMPAGRFIRAFKACTTLLTEAGRHDVGREPFEADLALLSADGKLAEILMPGFDGAMEGIKRQILFSSLADHGNLLIGVDWRVDVMVQSHRAKKIGAQVTQVTLRYVEGKQERRLTLQVVPELLQQLQAMCQQVLA